MTSRTPSKTQANGRGHGKLILFGEHAVVYGKPAVAAGLPRGARAEAKATDASVDQLTLRADFGGRQVRQVEANQANSPLSEAFQAILSSFARPHPAAVDVTLTIPSGVGLGSSAAFGVATARALGNLFDQPEAVGDAVQASEEVFHGNPSGLDQAAAAEGGLLFFSRDDRPQTAPIEAPPMTVAICQAGPPVSTADMVDKVTHLKQRNGQLVDYINLLIGDIVRAASEALRDGDWSQVGELMDMNHGALSALGVTTAALDAACHTARRAGALGAKLTGAGGGGCIVALAPDGADAIVDAWASKGWGGFEVTLEA